MSSDLEGDFEKEITALASSMNTTVEHIQVQRWSNDSKSWRS